jgi:DNA repair exonuclease SbcCD ATPase subunit
VHARLPPTKQQASRDRRQLELVTEERDEAVKTVNVSIHTPFSVYACRFLPVSNKIDAQHGILKALQERLQRVDLWKSAGDPSSPLHDSSDPDPPLSARGQRELEKRKKLELLLQHQQEKLQEQARQLGEQTRLIQRQTEYLNELKDRLNDATQKSDVVRSQSFSDREYFVRELDLLQAQLSEVGEEVHRRAELERSLREELSKCKEKLVDAEKEQEDAQASRMRQIGTQIGADATQLSHDIKKTDERRQDIRVCMNVMCDCMRAAIRSAENSLNMVKKSQAFGTCS